MSNCFLRPWDVRDYLRPEGLQRDAQGCMQVEAEGHERGWAAGYWGLISIYFQHKGWPAHVSV